MRNNARALSFAVFLSGSLTAAPALAEEAASVARPGFLAQAATLDAQTTAATDGLWLQLSDGYWEQAIDELRPRQLALERARQLSEQVHDAKGDGGSAPVGESLGAASADDLARESNNPLGGDFILWLNFFDIDQNQGNITDQNRYSYSHLFQPVIPFAMPQIGEHWILVNRPTFPTFIDQEVPGGPNPTKPGISEFDNKRGFGDIEYFALLGTSTPTESGWLAESFGEGDTVLAGGFTTRFPTGKSSLSENVYAAGPAATAAYVGKDWTFAVLGQHWWDYAKQGDRGGDDFNFTRMQVFYFKTLPDGWQVGGSPTITADWSESRDDRWTVPIGLGVFKTTFLGDLPIKLGVEIQPSIIRPDSYGSDWKIQFSIIPITPNFVSKLFE